MVRRIVRTLSDLETAYITVPEFARHLHVGRRQVRKWIEAGALPAVRIEAIWRIKAVDAEAFIAANRFTPVPSDHAAHR